MNYKSLLSITLLFILIGIKVKAQSLEKGFEALDKYNYYDAKLIFEKRLKKDSSISAYGLAKIYYQQKSPLYNIYKATNYINLSFHTFQKYNDKEKKKLLDKYLLSNKKIDSLRQTIANIKFSETKETKSIDSVLLFIKQYYWYNNIIEANQLLSKLEFNKAIKLNTLSFWLKFDDDANNYQYHSIAKHHIDSIEFQNAKINKDIDDLRKFTLNFTDNEYIDSAYYLIYNYSINKSTNYEDYHIFIIKNKENPFIKEAWKKMAHNYFKTYNEEEIENFIKSYPDNLINEELYKLLEISKMNLYPFKKDSLWGYINDNSQIIIEAKYQEVSNFSDGKAKIMLNDKYGFINYLNEMIIEPRYTEASDFHYKYTIVENNNQFYLIDINNKKMVTPLLKDSYWLNSKFAVIESSQGYQYFNSQSESINNIVYEDIFSLDYNYIIAKKGTQSTLISLNNIKKDSIENFEKIINKNYYLTINENIKIINSISTEQKIEIDYDYISQSYNNRILVIKNNKIAYLNDSLERVLPFIYPYKNYRNKPIFKNEYVMILYKNKWGAMNTNGEKVLPSMFEGLKYENGLFVGKKNGKWGVVNVNTINWYIKPKYEFISVIDSTKFITINDKKLGIIDINENLIFPFEYEDIKPINNITLLKKENFYYVFDNLNNLIISKNNSKYYLDNNILYVYKNGDTMAMINTKTGKVLYNSETN